MLSVRLTFAELSFSLSCMPVGPGSWGKPVDLLFSRAPWRAPMLPFCVCLQLISTFSPAALPSPPSSPRVLVLGPHPLITPLTAAWLPPTTCPPPYNLDHHWSREMRASLNPLKDSNDLWQSPNFPPFFHACRTIWPPQTRCHLLPSAPSVCSS